MKKILSTILILIFLPSLAFTQSSQDKNTPTYISKIFQNIDVKLKKITLVFNQTQDLAFKRDEINNYKIRHDSLEILVDELFEFISLSKNEPNLTNTESDKLKSILSETNDEYWKTVKMIIADFNGRQDVFIGLVGMTGENKVIKNKVDLDKIMEVYLSFVELTEHYYAIVNEISRASISLEYEKELKFDNLTCKNILGYMNFCDDFDKNYKRDYILSKDSVVNSYYALPEKYQSITIINTTIAEKEEEFKPSDTVKERNIKIGQRANNAIMSITFPLFSKFIGHYSSDKSSFIYSNGISYVNYTTNFTDKLRKEILEIMEIKNCK